MDIADLPIRTKCLFLLPCWISRCKDDDIKEYATKIDGKAEKNTVLIVRMNYGPHEGE